MVRWNIIIGVMIGIIFYGVCIALSIKINGCVPDLIKSYHDYMRGYFFSAFLGISSFLLSLLTFVVINLKEKMFDSDDYIGMYRRFNGMSETDNIIKKDIYRPLVVITTLLVISISACIITAILQFTVGFSNNPWLLIIPTSAPFFAITFMSLSLLQMTQLIYQWLCSEEVIKESSKGDK